MDNCNPLSIAKLGLFSPNAAVRGSNYHGGDDNAHHKAGLVEIVDIVVVTEAIVPTTEASTLYNTIQMTSSQTCYLAHLLVG